jgi:hypothetical protein
VFIKRKYYQTKNIKKGNYRGWDSYKKWGKNIKTYVTLTYNRNQINMKDQLEQILDNSTILTETNLKLSEDNLEAIGLVKNSIRKNEELHKVALQIYESLCDKKHKSVREISWKKALKKVFEEK